MKKSIEVTDAEKLAAVDRLIEDFRWARPEENEVEHQTYLALKAIAADMRTTSRTGTKPAEAFVALSAKLQATLESRTALGYDQRRLCALAEELIGRWHAVRLSLLAFQVEQVSK